MEQHRKAQGWPIGHLLISGFVEIPPLWADASVGDDSVDAHLPAASPLPPLLQRLTIRLCMRCTDAVPASLATSTAITGSAVRDARHLTPALKSQTGQARRKMAHEQDSPLPRRGQAHPEQGIGQTVGPISLASEEWRRNGDERVNRESQHRSTNFQSFHSHSRINSHNKSTWPPEPWS